MRFVSALLFAFIGSGGVLAASTPPKPALTYLYTAEVVAGTPTIVGNTPLGFRAVIPIVNGTFKGPSMSGKVLSGTIWALQSSTGVNTADAVYLMETDEGEPIMVTEKAHLPNINIYFETASQKYAWLNNVTAFTSETPSDGVSVIDAFAVGLVPGLPKGH